MRRLSRLWVLLFLGLAAWSHGSPNGPPAIVSNINNAPAWQATHAFAAGATVVNGTSPLRGYRTAAGGTSGSSGGPVTTGATITDGSVVWKYLSDVQFQDVTSWLASIPAASPGPCSNPYYITMASPYTGLMWNGGEYNLGTSTITFAGHTDDRFFCGENPPANAYDQTRNFTPTITLKPAPGEGFRDAGTHVALAYNAANGVAIHNNTGSNPAIGIFEAYVVIDGLQVKNDSGIGIQSNSDNDVYKNFIFDGGTLALTTDNAVQVVNGLIISRGSDGIHDSYNGVFDHLTVVHPGGGGSIGIVFANPGFGNGYVTLRNSVFMGFAYASGSTQAGDPNQFSTQSDNNAIDLSSSSTIGNVVSGATTARMPGSSTLFSVPFDGTTFVNASTDFRLATGSTLIGAGLLGPTNTFTANATVPTKPATLINTDNTFTPAGSPMACCAIGNMPNYQGMSISGSGVPAGEYFTLAAGSTGNWIFFLTPGVLTGSFSGATYTSTWHPFDDLDILGTPRGVAGASEDIGAIQWTP